MLGVFFFPSGSRFSGTRRSRAPDRAIIYNKVGGSRDERRDAPRPAANNTMPKVALVFPYFRTRVPTEMLFPPLGAAALAAQLARTGVEARVFDGTFQTLGGIRQALKSYQPDVVGIYCMITLSRNTFQIAELVRNDLPEALLVAGGPLPTLYPDHFTGPFDAVFRGEADLSFPRFCRDYLGQGLNRGTLARLALPSYEGLTIQNHNAQVSNPFVHYPESAIQAFPIPDRSHFDHAAYQAAWSEAEGFKTTSIMTTLGCPFSCDFCSRPVFGNVFRRRNLDAVFEEISQIRRLGYDSLWIADDNFTLDLEFARQFCERMEGQGLTWTCLSRVTGLDQALVRAMKRAGCRRVYLGLEAGSPETLKLMHKHATLDDGAAAVALFHAAGVETAAFFIVGYPGETTASIEATFRHALSLPLDKISFNVPFPLPGTKLFERVAGLDEAKDWNQENEVTFVYDSEFDPAWLRGRIRETMALFAEKKKAG
jgi:anaerobic magnesium-protoporphyrin IX monomethyl ester cyclase